MEVDLVKVTQCNSSVTNKIIVKTKLGKHIQKTRAVQYQINISIIHQHRLNRTELDKSPMKTSHSRSGCAGQPKRFNEISPVSS